ncbi:MAG: flagellar assembly protein FliW [Bdellovibrionales bacterium RBG_16_40_8]|nr:MAG: flagellar assembly protein FliW [Bdellovibrionales bacterium RBG_16_40_8]
MRVQTSRFGEIEVALADILEFAEGLLGFGELHKFVLLDDPNDDIFAWLQSCDNSQIAFPVLEPELFSSSYQIELPKSDLEALDIKSVQEGRLLTIITIPVDPTQMTANMKAPIVINGKKRIARQCVLQDNSLQIREPIFTKLQQRVVQNPSASLKAHTQAMGAIRVRRPEAEV